MTRPDSAVLLGSASKAVLACAGALAYATGLWACGGEATPDLGTGESSVASAPTVGDSAIDDETRSDVTGVADEAGTDDPSSTVSASEDGTSSSTGDPVEPPTGLEVFATVNDFVAWDVTQGWTSTRYVPSLQRFVAIFVNHHSPGGYQDNSLRAFDPMTGTIEYLHPKDVPGAPQDRDNHLMIHHPLLNQIWVSGGWQILDIPAAQAAADVPPSFGAVGWSEPLDNPGFSAAADISGFPSEFRKWNAAVAWDPSLDIGVIWGGSDYTGAAYSSDMFLIRPDTEDGQGYVFVNVGNFDALVPAGYVGTANGRHNGAILGEHFHTLTLDEGVDVQPEGAGLRVTVRLWRYPLEGPDGIDALQAMAPLVYDVADDAARYGMYFPCVTADTGNNLLLAYLATEAGNNLHAYLPDYDEWVVVQPDVPAGYRALAGCDYSPDHAVHAYWDGLNDRPPEQQGWGTISLIRSRD